MIELSKLNRIHFIGIGGIGMSALAKYFLFKNFKISGYDRIETNLTQNLFNEGAFIKYEDNINLFPNIGEIDLVVYTPAITEDNNQMKFFKENKIPMYKRAKVLGMITNNYNTIAIAGTHGKTTTSSISAHIINRSQKGGVAFLGGIANNYNSNILLSKGNLAVVEADEYDRSFLELKPNTIVLTSMDADHLDVYEKRVNVEESFLEFTDLISDRNKLIVENSLKGYFGQSLTYGFSSESDLQIINLKIKNNSYSFDFKYQDELHAGFTFKLPGRYNLLNAAGAVFSCLINGISFDNIKEGLDSFSGVKRRFEVHVENHRYIFIDDYAHHPKEIKVLINAIREFYPKRKIKGIFQPHLFSRTRDFIHEFSDSLSMLDELIILPIYAARERPIEGVSSSVLYEMVNLDKKFLSKGGDDYFNQLYSKSPCVIVTIGAGDINLHVDKINNLLSQNA
tara:strand:- start:7641 stop:8999 length:1359 start_codon:yes stop_codon:yes gene_type:complete